MKKIKTTTCALFCSQQEPRSFNVRIFELVFSKFPLSQQYILTFLSKRSKWLQKPYCFEN